MIKILLLLSLFLPLQSEQNLYDFPQQHQLFLHHLHSLLRQSSHIAIATSSFSHPELQKQLIKKIKNGNSLTLILQEAKGPPVSLVQYQGIDLKLYPKRRINGTLIVTENEICTLSVPLDSSVLDREKSFGWCSDEPQIVSESRLVLERMFKHSSSYLK